MVINPIVGVYIPIIRIPIKGGMTIPSIATFDHGTYDKTNPQKGGVGEVCGGTRNEDLTKLQGEKLLGGYASVSDFSEVYRGSGGYIC